MADPSLWVQRFAPLIAAGGSVLDLACGGGRHARWLAAQGYGVQAVDRDLTQFGGPMPGVHLLQADLERGDWPFVERAFHGVVVTNYLHRPLFPHLVRALKPEGVLIYETFAVGNERFGKPSNPDYLLRPGELLEVVRGHLRVTAYEDVEVREPKPAMVQRICAVRLAA